MKGSFIDVGREYDSCCEPAPLKSSKGKKISYPSLYISGVKGLSLQTGDIEFTAKGKVVSVSHRTNEKEGDQFSVEIEVHAINAPGAVAEEAGDEEKTSADMLGEEISKIAAKKGKPAEDDGEDDEE